MDSPCYIINPLLLHIFFFIFLQLLKIVLTSPPTCVLVGVPHLIEVHFPPFYGIGGGDDTITSTLRKYVSMRQLKQAGKILDVVGDGNCLFRCLALYLYDNQERHSEVRKSVANRYIEQRVAWENDGSFFDTRWAGRLCRKFEATYDEYVEYLSTDKKFGDTICVNAFLDLYPHVSYMLWYADVIEEGDDDGDIILCCQAARIRSDISTLHPLDDPSSLQMILYAKHFQLIKGLTKQDVLQSDTVPHPSSFAHLLVHVDDVGEEEESKESGQFSTVLGAIQELVVNSEQLASAPGERDTRLPTRGGRPTHAKVQATRLSTEAKIGGDRFDEAIVSHVRRRYGSLIGDATAERIKLEVGCAFPGSEMREIDVRGRNLAEGVPRSFTLNSDEILESLKDPLEAIVQAVKSALEQSPPELASDIAESGIVLTGGGALLRDLDRLISEETGLPVIVADDPLTCVARGGGLAMERMDRRTIDLLSTE